MPLFTSSPSRCSSHCPQHHMVAHDLLKLPRWVVASAMCGAMIGVIVLVEVFTPNNHTQPLTHAWSPILCGAILGALQVPLFLFLHRNMGASSAFVTVVSTAICCTGSRFKYFAKFRPGFANWWQVIFSACAAAGAAVSRASSSAAAYDAARDDGLTPAEAIVGGFLIIFGARLANGCTSGQGITGMAHLAVRSMIAVRVRVRHTYCGLRLP